jgi:hypothetical protein
MHGFEVGSRVRTHKWSPEVHDGTVTRVHEDGETIYVKWDGAAFTEDEVTVWEVEPIEGTGDPAPPYLVIDGPPDSGQCWCGGTRTGSGSGLCTTHEGQANRALVGIAEVVTRPADTPIER